MAARVKPKVVLLCFAAALFITVVLKVSLPAGIGRIDLSQYWAAGRLFLSGANPYDPAQIRTEQAALSGVPDYPILMWNPPWGLPLVAPISLLPFDWAVAVCFLVGLLLILFGFRLELLNYPALSATFRSRIMIAAIFLTFHAWRDSLFYGQISALTFVGLSLFLWQWRLRFAATYGALLGGAGLALTFLKPHALFLLYLVVFFEVWRDRFMRKACCYAALLVCAAFLAALLWQPKLAQWYALAWQSPPIYWKTPTVGSWLQAVTGQHSLALRLLPTILAAGSYLVFFRGLKLTERNIALLLPLSLSLSPYTWGYDHLLLTSSLVYILGAGQGTKAAPRKRPVLALLLANLVVIAVPQMRSMEMLIWYPPLIFLLVLGAIPSFLELGRNLNHRLLGK